MTDVPESEPAATDGDAAPFAIGVPADDDAAPFANIDVPAYRQELERRQHDADALAVVAAADVRNRAGLVARERPAAPPGAHTTS